MKKIIKAAVCLGLTMSVNPLLHAGDKAGNGGGAFVCRANGQITKAMTYDLWAGMNDGVMLNGKPYYIEIERHNRLSAKEQAYNAFERIEKLNSGIYSDYRKVLDLVIREVEKLLSDGKQQRLPRKNDFNPFTYPEESFCPDKVTLPVYETAIIYYDRWFFDEETKTRKWDDYLRIYDAVINGLETETDLAALYIHETLYKADRRVHEWNKGKSKTINSDKVRGLVAIAFSNEDDEVLNQVFLEAYYPTYKDLSKNEFYRLNKEKIASEAMILLSKTTDVESFEALYNKEYFFLSEKIDFDRKGVVYKEVKCSVSGLLVKAQDYYQHYTILSSAVRKHNYELVKFLVSQKGHSPHERFQTCGLFSNELYQSTLEYAKDLDVSREHKAAHKKIVKFLEEQ